jgi:hypothetical protein
MRKRKVAEIVAQCRDPKRSLPIHQAASIREFWKRISNLVIDILGTRHHIEYTPSDFHNSERMLESSMSRRGIQEICEC